ncbi:hypothetical protein ACT4US_25375, partial [Bacillus sp. HC-Mk]
MKLAKLALIGAVTLSSVSVGTSAFAAEKDGGKLDSKAFIKFEKNTVSSGFSGLTTSISSVFF